MKSCIKIMVISILLNMIQCTIDGISYMDPVFIRKKDGLLKAENPCNPLYWYPKNIPEYCYYKQIQETPKEHPLPIPLPLPIPQPQPLPMPQPSLIPQPLPIPQPAPFIPYPVAPLIPMPLEISPYPMSMFNAPLPTPFFSVPGPLSPLFPPPLSYTDFQPPRTGMVPGLPGLVTRDGGINILPFSDVYSDLLEKHANKLTRRKIQKLLDRYRVHPKSTYFRRLSKYTRELEE